MSLDSWTNEEKARLDEIVHSTSAVSTTQALSVRIPAAWAFTRVCLPPLVNTLRERFVFWCADGADIIPAGYLVGWKKGWRHRLGLWHMRFLGSLYDFILKDSTVTVIDSASKEVATIRIHRRLVRMNALEIAGEAEGRLCITFPELSFRSLCYMTISDESGSSFRTLFQWINRGFVPCAESGIVGKVPSFWPLPFTQQHSDELAALLFHPDDLAVVSRLCDRWTPALLTCLCVWAKCFETPRNGYW